MINLKPRLVRSLRRFDISGRQGPIGYQGPKGERGFPGFDGVIGLRG